MPAPIKVLVANSERPMFEGLVALLADHQDLDVLGVASTADDAVKKAQVLKPDVLLLDMHLDGADGPAACRQVRAAAPGTVVLFLTADDSSAAKDSALQAGAAEVLTTGATTGELVSTIRRLADHEVRAAS